jgi:hypothetical protein
VVYFCGKGKNHPVKEQIMKCEECKYNGTLECYAIKLAKKLKRPVTPDGCSKGEPNDHGRPKEDV